MDVNLLSRLVRELIIDNDTIPLPGIGYLYTEPVPAFFSKDRKTIYPPSKLITLRVDSRTSDDMLANYYAEVSGLDIKAAKTEFDIFIQQLRITLLNRVDVELSGIGTLRCSPSGEVFFEPDTQRGVFSQAFGFQPVVLRPLNRYQIAREEAEAAAKAKAEAEAAALAAVQRRKRRRKVTFITLAVIILIAAAVLFVLGRNGYLDQFIYSPEELEFIRQQPASNSGEASVNPQ